MQELRLKVYKSEKNFFAKAGNILAKILPRAKTNFNSTIITIKRKNAIKKYNLIDKKAENYEDFEYTYTLYIESLNNYIMNNIYKKVKNELATTDEIEILSKYYFILQIKDTEYMEYKYRKQKYLLNLDYNNLQTLEKEKLFEQYKKMYYFQIKDIYQKLFSEYSKSFTEKEKERQKYFEKISSTLKEYIEESINEENDFVKQYNQLVILDDSNIINKFKIENLLLQIAKENFSENISEDIFKIMYENLIKNINDYLNENIELNECDNIYELLINVIKENNKDINEENDIIKLELDYISKDEERYIKLKEYIEVKEEEKRQKQKEKEIQINISNKTSKKSKKKKKKRKRR